MASTKEQEAMSGSDLEIASQSGTDIGDGSNVETPTGETVTEDSEDGVCNISIEFTEVSDLDPAPFDTEYTGNDTDGSRPEQAVDKFQFLHDIDFSSRNWYQNDCFRTYWAHYGQAMSWCQKHFKTYDNVFKRNRSQFVPQSPLLSYVDANQYRGSNLAANFVNPHQYSYANHVPCERVNDSEASTRSKSRPRRRRGGKKQSKRKATSDNSTTPDGETTQSEIEMEITQDMIDFFAKSDEHRRQRDEAKNGEGENDEEAEHINVEQVKVGGERVPTSEAPKERPGARRTAEMKQLYGKGAAMIHGMETALQMAFDRNTDTKQPKVWPNMPLNIVFS